MKHVRSLKSFKAWAEEAQPGDRTTYTPTPQIMSHARVLFEADQVILYQKVAQTHHDGSRSFDYVAERVSSRAAGWLNRMSKAVPAPYNRYAHEEGLRVA